jgi:4-amino-4-deoxy-L-arabinose transferase-like glycosyltransferase
MTKPFHLLIALLALLAIVFAAYNIQDRKLANPDEGRYAELGREMAVTGDFVTPRLNGLKYFEKPPLQYWATALAVKAFGNTELAGRLWTVLCALIMIAMATYTAWQCLGRETGIGTLALLLSSWYVMALAQINTLDMGVSCWLTVSWCAFVLALRASNSASARQTWMIVAWSGAALAVLSKGLIGIVFPAGAMCLYVLISRRWGLLKLALLNWGPLAFAIITVPWFWLVAQANPEFLHFFFIHEHFQRFTSTAHRRTEPWWFFVPFILTGFGIWALALLPAIRKAVRSHSDDNALNVLHFALIWSMMIMLFFSLSGSKLPAYVLPVFPALAMIAAYWVVHSNPTHWWPLLIVGALLACVLIGVGLFAPEIAARRRNADEIGPYFVQMGPWFIAAGELLLAAALLTPLFAKRHSRTAALLFSGLVSTLAFQCVIHAYDRLSPLQSSADIAQMLRPHITPTSPVYAVGLYDQPLPYYLNRTVTLVAYVDEFETGLKAEPQKAVADLSNFFKRWRSEPSAVAIIHPELLDDIMAAEPRTTKLYGDRKRVVIKRS